MRWHQGRSGNRTGTSLQPSPWPWQLQPPAHTGISAADPRSPQPSCSHPGPRLGAQRVCPVYFWDMVPQLGALPGCTLSWACLRHAMLQVTSGGSKAVSWRQESFGVKLGSVEMFSFDIFRQALQRGRVSVQGTFLSLEMEAVTWR